MSGSNDRFLTLPSGRLLDLERDRWDGVLDAEELDHCRRHSVPISYDCAQLGWVPSRCRDDGAPVERRVAASPPASTRAHAIRRPTPAEDLVDLTERTLQTVLDLTDRQATELDAEVQERLDPEANRVARDRGPQPADGFRYSVRARLFATRTALLDRPAPPDPGAPTIDFRRWTDADVAVYRALLDDPRVWEHLPEPYPDPVTDEVARTLIDITSLEFHHDATAVLVDGAPVGQCVLRFDEPVGSVRAAEVSYWLGRDHWGRGLMSSILPRFTARSFERHPDVEVVYAWISPENRASIRVAERSGYHRDACSLEPLVAESIRRPGWERYATYRSQW